MSAVRHQASYNGIIFNRVYSGTDPDDPDSINETYRDSDYRLEVFDDSPVQIRDYSEPRQQQEGSEPDEAFESLRLVRGSGKILAESYADLEDKTWALRAAVSPANVRRIATQAYVGEKPDAPTAVLPFRFERDTAGGTKKLLYYCRPQAGRPALFMGQRQGLVRPFSFQLAAYDPRAYDDDAGTWQYTTLTSLAGGTTVVPAGGNTAMYPQIYVVMGGAGQATVVLANSTTGQQVTFDLSTMSSNFWIQPEKGLIFRHADRANRYYLKTYAAEFLANLFLAPGNNSIVWSGPTGISSVTFYYRSAYA